MDYLPPICAARQKMMDTIFASFASFGFEPIETPVVEFRRTLAADAGETSKQIFSVVNREVRGEELALRFDHTVPLARLVAQYPYNAQTRQGIQLPWRRMVAGPVFRGERPQHGRYRQFTQFDADIVGTDEMMADAEIIVVMAQTLRALGVSRFRIHVNNRRLLAGLGAVCGIDRTDSVTYERQTREMMRIIDKLDKIGRDDVAAQLATLLGDDGAAAAMAFLSTDGTTDDIIAQCRALFAADADALQGVDDLAEVMALVRAAGISADNAEINLTIARGLEYYTGTVMETTLTDAPQFGSVFSGGRYDGLVRRFTGADLPAVGASVGVDRLFAALEALGAVDQNHDAAAQVVVLRIMPDNDALYMRLAARVREAGMRVAVALLRDTTFRQQFAAALHSGARYAVICGTDEYAAGTVIVRDLRARTQETLALDDIVAHFAAVAQKE